MESNFLELLELLIILLQLIAWLLGRGIGF